MEKKMKNTQKPLKLSKYSNPKTPTSEYMTTIIFCKWYLKFIIIKCIELLFRKLYYLYIYICM